MSTLTVLNPVAAPGDVAHVETRALDGIAGLRIAVLDNTKPNAVEIMETAARRLVSEHGAATYRVYRKLSAAQGASPQLLAEIARDHDLVITGSGDCGGCTSWSALDAVELQRLGLPAVLMVTDSFMPLAEMLLAQAGAPDMRVVQVPHPIGGRPTDEVLPVCEHMTHDILRLVSAPEVSTELAHTGVA